MNTVQIKNRIIGEGRPKICVPITGKTYEDILAQADKIISSPQSKNVDMVEFRGDYFVDLQNMSQLEKVLNELKKKFLDTILLFTIRSHKEGGEKLSFDSPSISEINAFVMENKLADMVDVELFSGEDNCKHMASLARQNDVYIVMSNHDFKSTPSVEEMVNRLTKMQELGASVAKIAVMPENSMQVVDLLKATTIMKEEYPETPVITISMGKLGAITRVSGATFGSAVTFATLEYSSAPGQLPIAKVQEIMDSL
ncbi:MAG: type I 3-dehydroquinate dehydratase [Lachnospiraceae bacterium]|nr:type I 3-dehydroquinate dehydratase [Lachnospiraceae bacterium]